MNEGTKGISPPSRPGATLVVDDAAANADESAALGPLLRRLSTDGGTLIRQEVSLAALEIQKSALTVAKESAVVALGGFFIAIGLVVLLVFVILALGRLLGGQYWLSTLIVGTILVAGGFLALHAGRRAIRRSELKPRRTIETLRETKEWAARNAERVKR